MLKQSFTLSVMLQAHVETVVHTVSNVCRHMLKQSFTLSVMLQAHVETVVYIVSNVADTH